MQVQRFYDQVRNRRVSTALPEDFNDRRVEIIVLTLDEPTEARQPCIVTPILISPARSEFTGIFSAAPRRATGFCRGDRARHALGIYNPSATTPVR